MSKQNYTTFEILVDEINSVSDKKVEITHHAHGLHVAIKLCDKDFPISINESEFNFMQDLIIDNGLKFGVELSTGVGVSTIALTRAFENTGGFVISLDSYYEEIYNISYNIPVGDYSPQDIEFVKNNSQAYDLVSHFIKDKNLEAYIDLQIGWSPKDLVNLIQKRGEEVDFVFLDCPKSDDEFRRDIEAFYPFLSKKCIICVHDTHGYTEKSNDLVKELFGKDFSLVRSYYVGTDRESHRYFPLAVIDNTL